MILEQKLLHGHPGMAGGSLLVAGRAEPLALVLQRGFGLIPGSSAHNLFWTLPMSLRASYTT